jgi:hypothetical protein
VGGSSGIVEWTGMRTDGRFHFTFAVFSRGFEMDAVQELIPYVNQAKGDTPSGKTEE